MSGLTLSTYSEFGLIVLALAVGKDWISSDWLVAMSLSLSVSILIAAPLSRKADELYDPICHFLKRFETKGKHPDDLPLQTAGERIARREQALSELRATSAEVLRKIAGG